MVTLILLVLGVVNNLNSAHEISTLSGGSQTILGGPVAAWESIKLMSGDGGGAFNANSAHPFENPTPLTNAVEIVAMLLIPVAFLRTFGVMIGDKKQGWALFTAAAALFVVGLVAIAAATSVPHGTVVQAVGAPLEGTEARFGMPGSALFGHVATASADGAANASYDSFASFGGAVLMLNMMLGEVAPGGAGSGLYGLVMMARSGRIHRWIDGRQDARIPQTAAARPAHEADQPLHPGSADSGSGRDGGGNGTARRAGADAQCRPARVVGGAVRLHQFGGEQRRGSSRDSAATRRGTTWRWPWPW